MITSIWPTTATRIAIGESMMLTIQSRRIELERCDHDADLCKYDATRCATVGDEFAVAICCARLLGERRSY